MKNVVACIVVVLMLIGARGALGQATKDADLDLVAKYVDQTAVGVIHVDLARLDTDAVMNDIAHTLSDFQREKDPNSLGVADEQLKRAKEDARAWRERFGAAGGRDLYLVVMFNPAVDPPIIGIVPTGPEAKSGELIELLKELPAPLGGGGRAVEGAILTGPESLTAGMPLEEPTRREEIVRELKRAGDAPVQLALIPADFVRRAIAENVTELPAELGGGPSTVLTQGVVSGSGSISVAPSWSLKLVLQSESEEAAQALATNLKKGTDTISERAGPDLGPELAKALTPRAEGSTVVIAIGNERIATLKRLMVPALLEARRAARRAVTASNMRQGVTGCWVYAQDHKDQWPEDLQTLVKEGIVQESMLHNPDRPEMVPAFEYIRPDSAALQKSDYGRLIVIYERYDKWPEKGIWVDFADGHLELVRDEAQFRKLLEYANKNKAK